MKVYVKITPCTMSHTVKSLNITENLKYDLIEVINVEDEDLETAEIPAGYTPITYGNLRVFNLPTWALEFIYGVDKSEFMFAIVDEWANKMDNGYGDVTGYDTEDKFMISFICLQLLYKTIGSVFVPLRIQGDTTNTPVVFDSNRWVIEHYVNKFFGKGFKYIPCDSVPIVAKLNKKCFEYVDKILEEHESFC